MVTKVEKEIVFRYLTSINQDMKDKTLKEKYEGLKWMKTKSNSIVICLSCFNLRNRYRNSLCCKQAPDCDLNTTYSKILEGIE